MTLDELNSLDPQNIGSWPLLVRIIVIALLCAAIAYGTWSQDIKLQLEELAKAEQKEITLKRLLKSSKKRPRI
jgi:type IV pilus assembly protein PilO